MPASAAAHASFDAFVDKLLADDQIKDDAAADAKVAAALAADAVADAVILKAKDDEIAALKKRIAELETPKPPPEPEPEPQPEPPVGFVPSTAAFKALTTAAERTAYLAKALQWYKDNTGAKGTLKASPIKSITTNGATYEGLIFKGTLTIKAKNVTLRNCRVEGGDWNGIDAEGSDGLTLENVTVVGAKTMSYNNAILAGTNAKIIRTDISVHQHAITPQGGPGTVVRENYVHDGYMTADKHVGGISIKGGSSFTAMLVERNWVYGQDTSCVFIKNDFGPVAGTIVIENWLLCQPGAGKPSYAAYSTSDGPSGKGKVTDTQFLNNVAERGGYGTWSVYENGNPQPVFAGNVDPAGNAVNG